jgi:RNA-directed DNA polymerase
MVDTTGNRRTAVHTTDKPFKIEKKVVYEAYKAVKSNAGAAGVDGQSIEQFEADLQNNLYKLWNRMSSGSYFPPPVRAVSIPKKDRRAKDFRGAHCGGPRGPDGSQTTD